MALVLGLVLLIIIVVIIIFVAIGIYFRSNPSSTPTDIPESAITYFNTISWLSPVVDDECETYRFPLSTDGEAGPINPVAPTLNSANIALANEISNVNCVDTDTLQVSAANHTCNNIPPNAQSLSENELAELPTNCRGTDGTIYTYNQTENYFATCQGMLYCPGFLSALAVGLDPENPQCLRFTSNTLILETCNINVPSQQWRAIYAAPGIYPTPSSDPSSKGRQGIISAIMLRSNNLFLVPQSLQIGSELTLTDAPSNFGFVWLNVPSLIINDNVVPAQIVYVGNLSVEQQSSISFSNPEEMAENFEQNQNYAIRRSGNTAILDSYYQGPSDQSDVDLRENYNTLALNTLDYNKIYFDPSSFFN